MIGWGEMNRFQSWITFLAGSINKDSCVRYIAKVFDTLKQTLFIPDKVINE